MVEIVRSGLGRVISAKLSPGEELIKSIKEVAEKANVDSGTFIVIGTLKEATFGFYSPTMKLVKLEEPLEILSCIGNVAKVDGDLKVHAHIVVSDSKFHPYGGHLLEGSKIDRLGEVLLLVMAGLV